MTKLLMFAGPGNSGKTTLLTELALKGGAQRGLEIEIMRSTTRSTYAQAGKENEAQALSDPSNPEFQDAVMYDFCNSALKFVNTNNGKCDLIVMDRSPYDYMAYYLTVFAQQLTVEKIDQKRHLADTYMAKLADLGLEEIVITPLPWPMPWSKDTISSDGWRADKTGKNFLWSSVLMSELQEAFRRPGLAHFRYGVNSRKRLHRLVPFAETGSIEVRAANMLATMFPDLHGNMR